jgi:hypothetical protein
MDSEQFDGLVRRVGQSQSRRQTLLGVATLGVATLGLRQQAHAQQVHAEYDPPPAPLPYTDSDRANIAQCNSGHSDMGFCCSVYPGAVAGCNQSDLYKYRELIPGESAFEGATPELLAAGAIWTLPSKPAALALQRVLLAPGGRTVTPAGDTRVVLIVVERGTLTVNNTQGTVVTRGGLIQDAFPAGTVFTMSAGDANLSPVGTGGELRNDGSEEVSLLAGILVPIGDGTGGKKHRKKRHKQHGGKQGGGKHR